MVYIANLADAVVRILRPIGNQILSSEAAAAAAIGTVLIAAYRLLYLRPEMLLDINVRGWHDRTDHVNATIALYVINAGNKFAEDVQLSITADAFYFENDIESTSSMSEDYQGATAEFEIKSGMKAGYVGGGRRHDINIGNPLYEGDVSKLYLGSAIFEKPGKHELKYSIACRGHGIRSGKITFEIDGENSRVVSKQYPTLLRNIKEKLYWQPELKRVQRVENQ